MPGQRNAMPSGNAHGAQTLQHCLEAPARLIIILKAFTPNDSSGVFYTPVDCTMKAFNRIWSARQQYSSGGDLPGSTKHSVHHKWLCQGHDAEATDLCTTQLLSAQPRARNCSLGATEATQMTSADSCTNHPARRLKVPGQDTRVQCHLPAGSCEHTERTRDPVDNGRNKSSSLSKVKATIEQRLAKLAKKKKKSLAPETALPGRLLGSRIIHSPSLMIDEGTYTQHVLCSEYYLLTSSKAPTTELCCTVLLQEHMLILNLHAAKAIAAASSLEEMVAAGVHDDASEATCMTQRGCC